MMMVMVLAGNNMGGALTRLLVSSGGDELLNVIPRHADLPQAEADRLHDQLRPHVQFSPNPRGESRNFPGDVPRWYVIRAEWSCPDSQKLDPSTGIDPREKNASLIDSMRNAAPGGHDTADSK
jgi:hypothetical protein